MHTEIKDKPLIISEKYKKESLIIQKLKKKWKPKKRE